MEVVDERKIPGIGCVNFLTRSVLPCTQLQNAYIVGRQLHPLLEVGHQRHDAPHGRHGGACNIRHVLILRRRMWAILAASERYAPPARRGRGAHRVALGFVEGMAAVRFLLLIVVERHSLHCQRCKLISVAFLPDGCLLRRGRDAVLRRARHSRGVGRDVLSTVGRRFVCQHSGDGRWQSRVLHGSATPTRALGRSLPLKRHLHRHTTDAPSRQASHASLRTGSKVSRSPDGCLSAGDCRPTLFSFALLGSYIILIASYIYLVLFTFPGFALLRTAKHYAHRLPLSSDANTLLALRQDRTHFCQATPKTSQSRRTILPSQLHPNPPVALTQLPAH